VKTSRLALVVALAAAFAAAQSPYAFHFEFDQPGVLPDATPGVAAFNPTGSSTPTLFGASCGVMNQTMTINPTYGAGFYNGKLGSYPVSGAGMTPGVPSFLEASFTCLGGYGGPGTYNDSTGVMGMYPGAIAQLILNVVTGDVALDTGVGPWWITPPGTAFVRHTYRIDTWVSGSLTFASLRIDGNYYLTGNWLTATTTSDGFYMGDGAGSSSIAANIAWDYLSVGQSPQGPGQANSVAASLFVNRSNTTPHGQPGLKGPFYDTVPAGSNLTFEWNGPANAPFVLFFGPQNPANSYFGCTGTLDVATPSAYADLTIMFDPFNPYTGFLFWLDGCGKASQSFSIPPWLLPGTPLGNFQGGVFQSSGCPFVLTAAHYVTT
jgi:hypothetical protein